MDRLSSDLYRSLNGDWSFLYFDSVFDVPDELFSKTVEIAGWNTIPVPGCWQCYGYDQIMYVNENYPFTVNPPHIPADNPAGVYAMDLTLTEEELSREAHVVFEGGVLLLLFVCERPEGGLFAGVSFAE